MDSDENDRKKKSFWAISWLNDDRLPVDHVNMKTFALSLLFLIKASFFLPGKDKVNVVLIFADDQGYGDLGCFGSKNKNT